jgi:cytochrome P450
MAEQRRPVTDWSSDFDHTDAQWAADPYVIWDELRHSCPVARSTRFGGAWLPTRHADITEIAYDTERFTSRSPLVTDDRPPPELAPIGIAPPISSDPPYHREARRLLLPAFAPQAVDRYEAPTRGHSQELLAAVADREVVDAAQEYAQHIPVRVIADMLGLPRDDADLFRTFVVQVLEEVNLPFEERFEALSTLMEYLRERIEEHAAHPQDDLITYLLEAEFDGRAVEPLQVGAMVTLLLLAGIDTTWSAIGTSIWHLASHPQDRQRLVAEPALLPTAIEELLRAYSPVTMARLVRHDMVWKGRAMKADDWVLLPFAAANRDPAAFDEPNEVILDREINRHLAFGLGIHRCVGSHLARMELRVALESWLAAFPDFSLDDPSAVVWSSGQVRGPRTLPVRIWHR